MKLVESKNIIFRVANIKSNEFKEFDIIESYFYKNEKERLILEGKIKDILLHLNKLLYRLVGNLKNNLMKKKVIKLKRKINKQKYIDVNDIQADILGEEIIIYINNYNHLYLKYERLKKERPVKFNISDLELKTLINIYLSNKTTLSKAINLSSVTFLLELEKCITTGFMHLSNKKRNDLAISLYKYLIRATFKTSPFSFFCYQGIANFTDALSSNTECNKFNKNEIINIASVSLIKDNYLNKFYKINSDIWINKDYIEVLKKENVNYRNIVINNKRKLIRLENDFIVKKFIEKNINTRFNYRDIYNEVRNIFSLKPQETRQYIELMLNVGILEKELYNLETISPPRLKKLDLDDNRENFIKNMAKDNDPKIYEDVYFRKIININTFYPTKKQLKVLNKLSQLFDDSIILKYKFIEFIGETKTLTILDLIKILNDFYEKKAQIKNKEITNILSLRDSLLKKIKNNVSNHKGTVINIEEIDEIYSKLNLYVRKPVSYIFFIQPVSKYSFVLNKIFSGYGRMFSKFPYSDYKFNIIKEMHRKSLALINEDLNYVDLYGIYGFNANVHSFVTKYVIDLENIWNGDNLKDLSIQVHYEAKELEFWMKGKKVKPISLSNISSRMLPLVHRFLCDINHVDIMDLDMNKKIIFLNWEDFIKNKVTFIPKVQSKKIIISRDKWMLNIKKYKSYHNEINFYSELISDVEGGLIPIKFYVKPIDVKNINNINQMNDLYKPLYINLKNITSYKLLFRLTKKCNYLLLEESIPDYSNKKKYSGDFCNITTEIGVESYFI